MSSAALRRLVEDVAGFATDPLGYAMYAFPWLEAGPLEKFSGPRLWQIDVLKELRDHLSNPATRHTPKRLAIATGHGPGKTALIGMLTCWGLDTCPDTRIILAAGTEGQLVSKLSPELAKWRSMALTKDWFRSETLSHKSTQPGHAQSWRAELVPWNAAQPEAFAGLHNLGRRIIYFFDEASAIADVIWSTAEGALTDEGTELIFVATGNPTRAMGRFYDCFHRHRNLWSCRQIDSRTVEGTNCEYLDELVSTYGEDSDIARTRVKGQFPSQSSMSFVSRDVVDQARARALPQTDYLPSDPVIFGVDVARFGSDQSVLAIRQGRDARSRPWQSWSGIDLMQLASAVFDAVQRYHPDAIFVDGGGVGGGLIDRLRQIMGDDASRVIEVQFGSAYPGMEAIDHGGMRTRVKNKRAQMAVRCREWLNRGILPDLQQLADDLVAVEYSHDVNNAIVLERKDHMRARGLASPDFADALWLTFAEEIGARLPEHLNPANYGRDRDYDRYAEIDEHYDELYERYGTALPSALYRSHGGYDRYRDD